jgi:alkylation response protein AidB-like acyl-CoA dehydrogenase
MQLATPEQNELRAATQKVLARHGNSEQIRAAAASDAGHDPALWTQIADLGWLAITVPESLDGIGQGLTELAILNEEFGFALQPSPFGPSGLVSWVLGRYGADELQARLLPQLATGGAIASWGLDHPGGNGVLTLSDNRITGARRFIPDAQAADHLLVDVDSQGSQVLVVVDTHAPGVRVTPQRTMDLTRRYCTVHFENTPVAAEAVCADPQAAADLLRGAVALQCAESVGVARRLLEMTVDYAGTRRQFDRQIGSFQAVKHRIADMYIALEGAVAATEECTWAVEHRRSDADVAVHVAKSWTGRAASQIASEALQLHGGIGFTWEHDLHLFLRRAKVNELTIGAPSWHDERLFDALAAGNA